MGQKNVVRIESAKLVKVDPKLITISGYLIVPENRKVANGNKVKIPFVFVRRTDQSATKNVSLYATGGPGYSTIASIDSIGYNSGFLKYGGFIAFDQRGTKKAYPCLDCNEVEKAVQTSYREGKNQDSLVRVATLDCRRRLTAAGIDLSSYNTIESAADINDLRLQLKLDSLNLVGISYSGGLMLTVAKRHPDAVRSIVLNSPLPNFVSYENRALTNINEALEQVFANCKADSSQKYRDIRTSFHRYFSNLSSKSNQFNINYLEKNGTDSLSIKYGKSELLSVIVDRLNTRQVKDVPKVIDDLVNGNHKKYVKELIDGIFSGNPGLSLGMRYSVYCSGQIAFANDKQMLKEQQLYPWLQDYRFNNVNKELCDCWQVKAEPLSVRQPPMLTVPMLLSTGDIDPWTPPYYNMLMKKTMPNAQVLVFHNRGHGSGFTIDGINYLDIFMANPSKKLVSSSVDLTIR